MTTPRPDTIQFSLISANEIRYSSPAIGEAMPVSSSVKTRNKDPHPDYFSALDELAPFVADVMGLLPIWEIGSIGSLKLDWTDSEEGDATYKITSIDIARQSASGEIVADRKMQCPRIVSDDIPPEVLEVIDRIMDEAWSYCTGEKTSQGSLFEMAPTNISTRSKVRPLAIAS